MVFAASVPFWLTTAKTGSVVFIYIFCVPVFGFFTWFYVHMIRRMPLFAVAVDDEGIWLANALKEETFTPWHSVTAVVENHFRRRLVLTDKHSKSLIGLEYALKDFDRLRSLVVERASLAAHLETTTQQSRASSARSVDRRTYSRGITHHLVALTAVVSFAALGAYVGTLGTDVGPVRLLLPYIGGAISIVIAWEYLTTVHRLVVNDAKLELHWPLRHVFVTRGELKDIQLSLGGNDGPSRLTLLLSRQRRPVYLKGFRAPIAELYQVLLAWKKLKSGVPASPEEA